MVTFDDIKNSEKKKIAKSLKRSRDPVRVSYILTQFYTYFDRNFHDYIINNGVNIECKEGCDYCCYLKVDARAHEIFTIADHVEKHFAPAEVTALKERLHEAADKIAPLTKKEHLSTNISCGLLADGMCSVYSVRPLLCRKCHSTSVDMCRAYFENPTDRSIGTSEDIGLNAVARAAIEGFGEGLEKSRLDTTVYEINRALLYAMEDLALYKASWRKGEKAFPDAADAKN